MSTEKEKNKCPRCKGDGSVSCQEDNCYVYRANGKGHIGCVHLCYSCGGAGSLQSVKDVPLCDRCGQPKIVVQVTGMDGVAHTGYRDHDQGICIDVLIAAKQKSLATINHVNSNLNSELAALSLKFKRADAEREIYWSALQEINSVVGGISYKAPELLDEFTPHKMGAFVVEKMKEIHKQIGELEKVKK